MIRFLKIFTNFFVYLNIRIKVNDNMIVDFYLIISQFDLKM